MIIYFEVNKKVAIQLLLITGDT